MKYSARMRGIACIALFAAAALPATAQQSDERGGRRTEVPIRQIQLSSGVTRYAVPILVGGQPVLAGLDTGSVGLRLLPAAQHGLQPTGRTVTEKYDSGVQLDGPLARGRVQIGDRADMIGVHQVTSINCFKKPCGANLGLPDFGILGSGLRGEGFKALIGIKPTVGAMPQNPLFQLGVQHWIVSLPDPRSPRPGRLILDPDPRELAEFRPVPSGEHPGQILACLFRPLPRPSHACGSMTIDTGAPGLTVINADMPNVAKAGGPARIVFGRDRPGMPGMAIRLDDRVQMTRFKSVPGRGGNGTTIMAGVTPYLGYDILYGADGSIGVRPRRSFPGGPIVQP